MILYPTMNEMICCRVRIFQVILSNYWQPTKPVANTSQSKFDDNLAQFPKWQ